MKKFDLPRKAFAWVMVLCLLMPTLILAGSNAGRKNFNEGVKLEKSEQWDQAAQQYAIAVAAEPGNAEYRLRLARAMLMASLMFVARGDMAEAKGEFAAAYHAYAQAFTYDKTNEIARDKMARMLEQHRAQAGLITPVRYNAQTGAVMPASNEIKVAPPKTESSLLQRIEFNEGASLKQAINTLARTLDLNVVYDDSFKDSTKYALALNDTTAAKALDVILLQSKHFFEQLDRRTIMIYADNPPNRQRLERLLVKTFYLSNADPNEARTIVQSNLGGQRQVNVSKQLNALIVRATPTELEVAQALLDSLDKNRAEVIIDVNIFEVSNTTSLAIGNQIATSSSITTAGIATSLSDLGGIGRSSVASLAGSVLGFGGSLGSIIGLPTSSLSLLQTKGKSRLLASTQIHAADGEQNQTVVGRSVPIKVGTSYLATTTTSMSSTNNNTNNGTVDNIQYRDVGLVIDVTPTISAEGYVQVKMKLESSNVEVNATDSALTPSFTKRSLTTISRIQDGVTAVVASVKQDSQGDSRASIPVIGMVPILGRLFSTPKQTADQSDIVITVTPHISRLPDIKLEDHFARRTGTQQSGFSASIEEVIHRAVNEEEQGRRLIAQREAGSPSTAILVPANNKPALQVAAKTEVKAKASPPTADQAVTTQIFKMLTVANLPVKPDVPAEGAVLAAPKPESEKRP